MVAEWRALKWVKELNEWVEGGGGVKWPTRKCKVKILMSVLKCFTGDVIPYY